MGDALLSLPEKRLPRWPTMVPILGQLPQQLAEPGLVQRVGEPLVGRILEAVAEVVAQRRIAQVDIR